MLAVCDAPSITGLRQARQRRECRRGESYCGLTTQNVSNQKNITSGFDRLPSGSRDAREYLDPNGRSPYARRFDELTAPAAANVTIAITRLRQGNFSNVKGVGGGVHEGSVTDGIDTRLQGDHSGARPPDVCLRGNPQARNLFAIVAYLLKREGVRFKIRAA